MWKLCVINTKNFWIAVENDYYIFPAKYFADF